MNMKTLIKSAGEKYDEDYLWWQLLHNSALAPIADFASIDGVLDGVDLEGRDEKFTLLLRRKADHLCLLLYLPSHPVLIAKQKAQRIDFTGQRAIRNGFIWLAECETDDEQLRNLSAGLLQMSLDELIDDLEACFSFASTMSENQQRLAGFDIDAKRFFDVIERLQIAEVFCQVNVIKEDVLQMAHDNPARRSELCARLWEDRPLPGRELLVLIDNYADPSEIQEKYRDHLWCVLTAQAYAETWQIFRHNEPSLFHRPVDKKLMNDLTSKFLEFFK
jgi:hypothetical protein